MGNKSKKKIIKSTGSEIQPFLIYQPTAIDQKQIMLSLLFFTLLKLCREAIKNNRHQKCNLLCAVMSTVETDFEVWIHKKINK